ncbi:multidrug efflux SMR transporter [Leisingera daeponensis]|uniref:Guanidinium exporter n=1 Tax=Leisingera daeponensis TaxID=405746 RepID=A0ABS7NM16_9RHOB|nr:multidrug efflux SMR transporter [Leisingera daeponensis]MBY6142235.1 multidrug efflux SMR transporter [Leisingera daeponensis]
MAWVFLGLAGVLEIVWAFFMKKSQGFTLFTPSVITIITMVASFALLSVAMRSLPLGTAYTIWTGIGAVGAFVVGIAVLGEAVTPTRIVAAALIVTGIIVMKLSSTH